MQRESLKSTILVTDKQKLDNSTRSARSRPARSSCWEVRAHCTELNTDICGGVSVEKDDEAYRHRSTRNNVGSKCYLLFVSPLDLFGCLNLRNLDPPFGVYGWIISTSLNSSAGWTLAHTATHSEVPTHPHCIVKANSKIIKDAN